MRREVLVESASRTKYRRQDGVRRRTVSNKMYPENLSCHNALSVCVELKVR